MIFHDFGMIFWHLAGNLGLLKNIKNSLVFNEFQGSEPSKYYLFWMLFLSKSLMHFRSSIFMDLGVIFNDFGDAFRVREGIDFSMISWWISGGSKGWFFFILEVILNVLGRSMFIFSLWVKIYCDVDLGMGLKYMLVDLFMILRWYFDSWLKTEDSWKSIKNNWCLMNF